MCICAEECRNMKTTSNNNIVKLKKLLRDFFLPSLRASYLLRLLCVAMLSVGFFGHVCRPAWTNGESMLPSIQNHQFLFFWLPAYWFSSPKAGDIVVIKVAGSKVFLLKRVLATAGQRVAFKQGRLFVDGKAESAYWASLSPSDWNLPERRVASNHVFVVGDNRSMPQSQHQFGEVEIRRIVGKPILLKKHKSRPAAISAPST
jgi:signal peptidase I